MKSPDIPGRFNALLAERSLALEVAERFGLELRPVQWHASSPGDACQIMIPTVGEAWFDPDQLRERTIMRHGSSGLRCADCGVWRWMPLSEELLPRLKDPGLLAGVPIAASPEWFGSARNSYQEVLACRELAEMLAAASRRDLEVVSIDDRI